MNIIEIIMTNKDLTSFQHLHEITSKYGEDFVRNLLNSDNIRINLKIDGACLIVEKKDGELTFYNKNKRRLIDDVYRVANPVFNVVMDEIIEEDKEQQIPDGTYHLELLNRKTQNIIGYNYMYPNYWIPSYVEVNNKIIDWWGIKWLHEPPELLRGRLDNEQIDFMLNYTNYELHEFSKQVEYQFGKFYDCQYESDLIEGLVIYIDDKYTFKVVDPAFTRAVKEKNKPTLYDEYVDHLGSILWDYVSEYQPKRITNYIRNVMDITKDFLFSFRGMEFVNYWEGDVREIDKYFGQKWCDVVEDSLLGLELISRITYHQVLRMLLFGLQYERKRATKFIDREKLKKINRLINIINDG